MGYIFVFGVVGLCIMIYVIMGVVQLNAILAWARSAGWRDWAAYILSWTLAFIPVIGSATAVWAAWAAWNWTLLKAMLVFFWFPVLIFVVSQFG